MTDLIDRHQQAWRNFRASQCQQPTPATPGRATTRRRTPRAASSATSAHAGNVERLNLVKLEADLHRLSLQASRQRKHQLQAELLKSAFYAGHIQRVLAGQGPPGEDPVLVRCMIWLFNLAEIEPAMQLARSVIQRGLAMPDEFKASAKIFVCREIAYWALAEQKANRSPQPYLDEVYQQSRQWDKPDQVEARLLKAKGQAIQITEPQQALALYQQAIRLDAGVGVSQLIKRLQKQLQE